MLKLSFPNYEFRLKKIDEKRFIFDEIRKKYKSQLIAVEKKIILNNLTKRFDIIAYDNNGDPNLLVECKAPNIAIRQETFDQILSYNRVINSKYLMITNGIINYYCKIDNIDNKINFLKDIPNYK